MSIEERDDLNPEPEKVRELGENAEVEGHGGKGVRSASDESDDENDDVEAHGGKGVR
jgi:hypothetical protein